MFGFLRYFFDWKWCQVDYHEKSYNGLTLHSPIETSDYIRKRINNSFLYFIEECEYVISGYEKNASKEKILNSFNERLQSPVASKMEYTRDVAKAYWILRFKIPQMKKQMEALKEEEGDMWINKEEQIRYLEYEAAILIGKHIRSLWT